MTSMPITGGLPEEEFQLKSHEKPARFEDASWTIRFCNALPVATLLCIVFFAGSAFVSYDVKEKVSSWIPTDFGQISLLTSKSLVSTQCNSTGHEHNVTRPQTDLCENHCRPSGTETLLPKKMIRQTSDLEMRTLGGVVEGNPSTARSLLAIPVGLKQKEGVDKIVKKFPLKDFVVMLFHYDDNVDAWKDLEWSDDILHISAINQTKWWFAKRFLHPDVVDEYNYIFLWDEDLDVENFHPERYIDIVKREGLEISQPALDPKKSDVHHPVTVRLPEGDVHRRTFKKSGGALCYQNHTNPPCAGFVEMMAPVFSRVAWRCIWHLAQNDLIHAWGMDYHFRYCVKNQDYIGVVDSEYITHKGTPTLGGGDTDKKKVPPGPHAPTMRDLVKQRSFAEMDILGHRWRDAVAADKCWTDPYLHPQISNYTT